MILILSIDRHDLRFHYPPSRHSPPPLPPTNSVFLQTRIICLSQFWNYISANYQWIKTVREFLSFDVSHYTLRTDVQQVWGDNAALSYSPLYLT